MQGLMLILEIVVVLLVAIEVYIRFTGRRKSKKRSPEAELPPRSRPVEPAPAPQGVPAAPGQEVQEEALSGDDLLQEAG